MKKGILILLFVLAGCSPGRLIPGMTSEIVDWIDAVKWNDSTYYADYEMNDAGTMWETGKELGEVKFTMDGRANSKYVMKNEDATYLPTGTKIYEMVGYAPSFRVIAGGKVYEVNHPEQANVLGDFLDIDGKVKTVRFLSQEDGSLIGEMAAEVLEQFVDELLALDYDPDAYKNSSTDGYAVFLEIVLTDETTTRTSYWPESKFIWYGAIVSESLEELLAKELVALGF